MLRCRSGCSSALSSCISISSGVNAKGLGVASIFPVGRNLSKSLVVRAVNSNGPGAEEHLKSDEGRNQSFWPRHMISSRMKLSVARRKASLMEDMYVGIEEVDHRIRRVITREGLESAIEAVGEEENLGSVPEAFTISIEEKAEDYSRSLMEMEQSKVPVKLLVSGDGVVQGYLCRAGLLHESLFVDIAVTEKQRLDQGFEVAEAELLKQGNAYGSMTSTSLDGEPQDNLTRLVAEDIHLPVFLAWASALESPIRLEFRHVEGRTGAVYASYDPTQLHAYLSNAVLILVLRALDRAGGGDVWYKSLHFCSSATLRFGEDAEEAKEPDGYLAPKNSAGKRIASVVCEAAYLNESMRLAKINTLKWTGKFSTAKLALTVKVTIMANKIHKFTLLIGRRGQDDIEELEFGLDTVCTEPGLLEYSAAFSVEDIYGGGAVPDQLKGVDKVSIDLYELREAIIEYLDEEGRP